MVSSANLVSSGPFSQGSHEFPACLVVLHHLSREVVIEVRPGSGTRLGQRVTRLPDVENPMGLDTPGFSRTYKRLMFHIDVNVYPFG